ncbi:MAG TPA: 3-dehydroquinate synthase [Gemmatimonadaceae bacterium]|nr:3-dehydroquinate synthase [Gemmatimonadaceae bacterium]
MGRGTIRIEPGLLSKAGALIKDTAPAHRYAVITDSNVKPLYGDRLEDQFEPHTIDILTVPAGETSKTREMWSTLTDRMLISGFGRDSAIIALGGGVVGDLAGFVAATFMRGIPVVQVPTTLLAMIDASIGGKTGIDTPAGKNLVGAFHPPAAVIIDPQVLATLPLTEFRAGFAELIKYGAIADASYFGEVASSLPELLSEHGRDSDTLRSAIVRSVEIKTDIVSRDEREDGLRKVLNFGHTIGHAVEILSGYSLLHGEAVAIGMAVESTVAERIGVAAAGTAAGIIGVLADAGLPTRLPPGSDLDAIIAAMRSDKKRRQEKTMFALPLRIGAMAGKDSGWTVSVSDDQLREVLG